MLLKKVFMSRISVFFALLTVYALGLNHINAQLQSKSHIQEVQENIILSISNTLKRPSQPQPLLCRLCLLRQNNFIQQD